MTSKEILLNLNWKPEYDFYSLLDEMIEVKIQEFGYDLKLHSV